MKIIEKDLEIQGKSYNQGDVWRCTDKNGKRLYYMIAYHHNAESTIHHPIAFPNEPCRKLIGYYCALDLDDGSIFCNKRWLEYKGIASSSIGAVIYGMQDAYESVEKVPYYGVAGEELNNG